MTSPARPIKVLIVDDSAIVRKILREAVTSQLDMVVVGTAPDPYVARDKILALQPDVLTLDIAMPRMDGITFLKRLMRHHPLPTIIISSLGQSSTQAAVEAMRYGAVDVMAKPAGPYSVSDLRHTLSLKIRAAAAARPHLLPEPQGGALQSLKSKNDSPQLSPSHHVIAMGASTGGTTAIQEVLLDLPREFPGMVITQHIPSGFSLAFANRLNSLCALEIKEAATGDMVRPGLVLIAPGDSHLLLRPSGSSYVVELQQRPPVCFQRPSVDVMFASVAQAAGRNAVGVLLTGMGSDGAKGMLAMRREGAQTIAQNEGSCVVYGMPREAVLLGAVETVAPLSNIANVLLEAVRKLEIPAHA